MSKDDISANLVSYICETFLDGNPEGQLDEGTPLLEWGVLNSMNMVRLLSYIRDKFDFPVPPDRINAANFKNIGCMTEMIHSLRAAYARD